MKEEEEDLNLVFVCRLHFSDRKSTFEEEYGAEM